MEGFKSILEKHGICLDGFEHYEEDPTQYKKEVLRNEKYMISSKYYRCSSRHQKLFCLIDLESNETIYYGYKLRDLIIKLRGLSL